MRPEHFYDPELENVEGGTTFEVPVELVESMGSEVYAHFNTGESGAQSEELAELAADSGASDVPSAGEGLAVARLEPTTMATAGQSHTLGLHPETIHLFDVRSGRNLVVATRGGNGGAPAAQQSSTAEPSAAQPDAAPDAPPAAEAPTTATEPSAPTSQPEDESSGGDTTRLS